MDNSESATAKNDQPLSLSVGNISDDGIEQPNADISSLSQIPNFNELMLVYEVQYNATKDALEHFLQEQPNLILPLFTNVIWSLLINPLLVLQHDLNLNSNLHSPPPRGTSSGSELKEILPKPKSPASSTQNANIVQQQTCRFAPYQSNNHIRRTGGNRRAEKNTNNTITCNVCAKPLKNRAAFVKHRRRHLGISELAYVCATCGKRCRERHHLANHCRNKQHEMPSLVSQDLSNSEQNNMPFKESNEEGPQGTSEMDSTIEVPLELWLSNGNKKDIPELQHCEK